MRVVVTKRVGSRGEDRILSWSQGCWQKKWSNYFPRWHSDRGWGDRDNSGFDDPLSAVDPSVIGCLGEAVRAVPQCGISEIK